MQWTVRLEARTDKGEVKTAELVTFRRPAMARTLAEIGLTLAEAKALLTKLQASMLCDQLAEYAAHRRVCPDCGELQPLKDRRTRRLQTLFGTVEIEAPRFRVCRCRRSAPRVEVAFSPVSELLTARCTPELERVQAELGARTSFREAARILEALLPASPANHESVRTRTHAVALRIEAGDRRTAAAVVPAQDGPKAAGADGEPAHCHARRRLCACGAGPPGPELRGDLRQGRARGPLQPALRPRAERGRAAPWAAARGAAGAELARAQAGNRDQRRRPRLAGAGALGHGRPGGAHPGLVPSLHAGAPCRAGPHRPLRPGADPPRAARARAGRRRAPAAPALERLPRGGVRGPGPDRKRGRGRRSPERRCGGGEGRTPRRALHGAARLHREQRRCADRLRPALPGWQADLDLARRGHGQPPGQCPHEQAETDALVTARRASHAPGQGRGAGRTPRSRPAGNPTRGVAPQVFAAPIRKTPARGPGFSDWRPMHGP